MTKRPLTSKNCFLMGYVDAFPFLLIVIPFALLWGVVATEAGLNLTEVMAMTILVIAGSSQFTAISLMTDNAPTFIVLIASLTVNMRMAMYSAALVQHLGREPLSMRILYSYFMVDQAFALSIKKYEDAPHFTSRQKGIYYLGCALMLAPFWYGFSFVGAVFGAQIPPEYALDFAVPICFIALSAPMMRSLPHFVAATVSVIAALAFVNVPYSLGLMCAAILAMIAGVQMELFLKRRSANA